MRKKITERHGASYSVEYRAWKLMKARCLNENWPHYDRYGGRGIKICDRWILSFKAFLDDMGLRPSSDHTLERKDNDGNYEPSNCVWATRRQQGANRSDTRLFTFRGELLCIKEIARRTSKPYQTVLGRLRRGLTIEEAVG